MRSSSRGTDDILYSCYCRPRSTLQVRDTELCVECPVWPNWKKHPILISTKNKLNYFPRPLMKSSVRLDLTLILISVGNEVLKLGNGVHHCLFHHCAVELCSRLLSVHSRDWSGLCCFSFILSKREPVELIYIDTSRLVWAVMLHYRGWPQLLIAQAVSHNSHDNMNTMITYSVIQSGQSQNEFGVSNAQSEICCLFESQEKNKSNLPW